MSESYARSSIMKSNLLNIIIVLDFKENFQALLAMTSNPSQFTGLYAALISLLAANRYAEETPQLLQSFTERQGIPTTDMYTSAIYAQKFSGNYRVAEELLETLRLTSIAAPRKKITAIAGRSKDVNSVRSPLNPARMTIAPCNALLAVYSASKAPSERRKRLLTDIANLNLEWDRYTYTAIFLGLQNKTKVIHLWHQLSSENRVDPSYVSVIKVLNACLFSGDGICAMDVLTYLWKRVDSGHGQRTMAQLLPDANLSRMYSLVTSPSQPRILTIITEHLIISQCLPLF